MQLKISSAKWRPFCPGGTPGWVNYTPSGLLRTFQHNGPVVSIGPARDNTQSWYIPADLPHHGDWEDRRLGFLRQREKGTTNVTWWRHNIIMFPSFLVLCEGNLPVTGGFPSQKRSIELWCFLWGKNEQAVTWWRHQMETFSALLAICAGNSPVTGEFPAQRPVTLSFGVFFDLCMNKQLSNNGEAGNLRRHRTHYEVIVMIKTFGLLLILHATRFVMKYIT